LNPSQPTVIEEIINLYDDLDQVESSTYFLQSMLDRNPENNDLELGIAHSLLIQDQFENAIYYYEQLQAKGFQSRESLVGLAFSYSQTKQYKKAMNLYKQVVQKSINEYEKIKHKVDLDPESVLEEEEHLKEQLLEYWAAAKKTGNKDDILEAQATLERAFLN